MEFRILGPSEVASEGRTVTPVGGKVGALLAMLIIRHNQVVPAEQLAEGLWGDRPPDSAVNLLHGYISRLRRTFGPQLIVTRPPGYILTVDPECIDAFRFERLLEAGRSRREADQTEEAFGLLADALALWRGEALSDFTFETFAQEEIARLHELRLVAHEEHFDTELALGRHADVVSRIRVLVDAHPLRERLWGQLITALYRSGRQGDALRAFAELRRHLVEELGIEPSPPLRQLEHDVLLQLPELQWQPAARPQSMIVRENLPTYRSTFVGRSGDLAELEKMLSSKRLLTLVGPGGVGKTRLAVELARRVRSQFEHGSRWVELAPLAEAALVADAVAAALGVPETPGRSLREGVAAALGRQRVLVVLDNCEHVVDEVAKVVDTLLDAAPTVTVLATSREPLRVEGEHVWRAPPLAVPNHDEEPLDILANVESVRLFLDRAAARGDFALSPDNARGVARLCQRLDGLPLAIELAAARTPGLNPTEIAAALDRRFALLDYGLRNSPPRHQTLRAAIEWSHDALTSDERVVYRRLSVFSGAFSLAAAGHVAADDDLQFDEVERLIPALVDKSLLAADQRGEHTGYRMLESLCHYAFERLVEAGELTAVRRRHLEWYVALVEPASAFMGASRDHELDPLGDVTDNVRAALQAALDEGDVTMALRIINTGGFPYVSGGWAWTEKVVAAAAGAPPLVHAEALLIQGSLAVARGEFRAALAPRREALEIFQAFGDDLGIAVSLHYLAAGAANEGSHTEAMRLYGLSLDAWRRAGTKRGYGTAMNFVLHNLGLLAVETGDVVVAKDRLEEALVVARELDEEGGVAVHHHALGQLKEVTREHHAAARHYEESLSVARAIVFPRVIASNLVGLGRLALAEGELQVSARKTFEAFSVAADDKDRPGVMRALVGLASAAAAAGDYAQGAALLGASDRLLDAMAVRRPRLDRDAYESAVTAIQEQIGRQSYEQAWEKGRMWADDQRLEQARSVGVRLSQLPTTSDMPVSSTRLKPSDA